MSIKIFFDLDGTLYNLYGQKNWLYKLENEVSGVFSNIAENDGFMPSFCSNEIQNKILSMMEVGYNFGVISWLPWAASTEYSETCRQEKMAWIKEFLPMITDIALIPYGLEKQKAITKKAQLMYLIDDNVEVCKMWETTKQRKAIQVSETFSALDALNFLCGNK